MDCLSEEPEIYLVDENGFRVQDDGEYNVISVQFTKYTFARDDITFVVSPKRTEGCSTCGHIS